jgi:urease accessory protein
MKLLSHKTVRSAGLGALTLLAGAAQAHTGHDTSSMLAGLVHPFGLDHLLVMVAVGMWSVAALPAQRRWLGPLTFVGAMVLAAGLGALGVTLPFTEHAVALSLAVLGAMLVAGQRLGCVSGLALVALAATFHGLAHGAELPSGGLFAGYAIGFVATTAALHMAGVGVGVALRHTSAWVWRVLGAALGATSLMLLSQV